MTQTQEIVDAVVGGVILLVISGIAKVLYDYRRNIYVWLKRQKLKIFPANFDIAFSIDFQEGLNSGEYFKEIKNNFIENIHKTGLDKRIRLRDFSDIKKFENEDEAKAFVCDKAVDLIIWGRFSNDVLKSGGKAINKLKLNFTYYHPDDRMRKIGAMLLMDISSKLAIKNFWTITEDDSLHDVEIVSNNLFDVSTYIVGVILKLFGQIEKCIDILEPLYEDLVARHDDFATHIIPHLMNCYELMVIDAIPNRKKYQRAKLYCQKILRFKPDNYFGISNLALFQYRTGEQAQAQGNVETLLRLYPREAATEIDVAFFRILQGDYKNAFKHYLRLSKMPSVPIEPQQTVAFLGEEYEKTKEPAFLYGSAIISTYFGDRELAEIDFKTFLKKFNEQDCKQMYRNARRLLAGIQRQRTRH